MTPYIISYRCRTCFRSVHGTARDRIVSCAVCGTIAAENPEAPDLRPMEEAVFLGRRFRLVPCDFRSRANYLPLPVVGTVFSARAGKELEVRLLVPGVYMAHSMSELWAGSHMQQYRLERFDIPDKPPAARAQCCGAPEPQHRPDSTVCLTCGSVLWNDSDGWINHAAAPPQQAARTHIVRAQGSSFYYRM